MKRISNILFAALTVIAAASCRKEAFGEKTAPDNPNAQTFVFEANASDAIVVGDGVKSTISDTYQPLWCEGDQIAVWNGTEWATSSALSASDIREGGKIAKFQVAVEPSSSYTIVTPASAVDAAFKSGLAVDSVNVTIPAKQDIVSGACIARDALVQVATATELSGTVTFSNVTSLVRFSLPEEGITKVVLNADANLTGSLDVIKGVPGSFKPEAKLEICAADGFTKDAAYYATVLPAEAPVAGLKFVFTAAEYKAKMRAAKEIAFPINKGVNFTLPKAKIEAGKFPLVINNKADLLAFAANSADYSREDCVTLASDIEFNSEAKYSEFTDSWVAVVDFPGSFDGGNHSIYKLKFAANPVYPEYIGFFSKIYNNVKNLKLGWDPATGAADGVSDLKYGEKITFAGILAGGITNGKGTGDVTVSNVHIYCEQHATYTEAVSAALDAGNMVGTISRNNTTITDCSTSCIWGNTTGIASAINGLYVGGVVGLINANNVTIKNTVNSGAIRVNTKSDVISTDSNVFAGGIAGRLATKIKNCRIINCTFSGGRIDCNVNLKKQIFFGGILGADNTDADDILENEYTLTMDGCKNLCEGTMGDNATGIRIGASSSNSAAGGMIGFAKAKIHLKNCVNGSSDNENAGCIRQSGNNNALAGYGGMIGYATGAKGLIEGCVNYGAVACLAQAKGTADGVGGMIGLCNAGTALKVKDCANHGHIYLDAVTEKDIEKKYHFGAGGIIGTDLTSGGMAIVGCSNDGVVEKTAKCTCDMTHVGNIVGYPTSDESEIEVEAPANCFVAKPGKTISFETRKGNSNELLDCDAAALLWQDNKNLVKSVAIADNKITVELNEGKEGNAVVAASKNGTIVWSWNIWVLADEIKDVTVGSYTFMDRNVGAVTLDEKSEKSIGVIYQYGRKDPFPGIKGYDTGKAAYVLRDIYNASGEVVKIEIKDNTEANNIENSIKNPQTFYKNYYVSGQKHNYNWITTDATTFDVNVFKGLWENDGNKSVYDPCPKGYKVASIAAWEAAKTLTVTEIWDDTYVTPDASVIGTNEKWVKGYQKKVQFRGCYYGDLKLTVTGEVNADTGKDKFEFKIANCVGMALPTAEVWCANIDPDFTSKLTASYFRGTAVKVNTTGNGNYDDISDIKVNALSTGGKYNLNYALPVRCIKE